MQPYEKQLVNSLLQSLEATGMMQVEAQEFDVPRYGGRLDYSKPFSARINCKCRKPVFTLPANKPANDGRSFRQPTTLVR